MNYLRTFSLIMFLLTISIFNWMCSEDKSVNIISSQIQSDSNPCEDEEYLYFKVEEYVKITQFKDTPPYYEYRTVFETFCCDCFDSNCDCGSVVVCFHCSNFTTPSASRMEQGALLETQYYQYTGEAGWNTLRGGTLLWHLKTSGSSVVHYNNDTIPFDNAYKYDFTTTGNLPGNTNITAMYGKDAVAD
jgi:hypothetical protein